MIARKETKTITMKQEPEQAAEEQVEQQIGQKRRQESGRFRLQVDRQTKRSFATYEAAEQAGMAIKKSYPLLQVAIYDLEASLNNLIEVPKV